MTLGKPWLYDALISIDELKRFEEAELQRHQMKAIETLVDNVKGSGLVCENSPIDPVTKMAVDNIADSLGLTYDRICADLDAAQFSHTADQVVGAYARGLLRADCPDPPFGIELVVRDKVDGADVVLTLAPRPDMTQLESFWLAAFVREYDNHGDEAAEGSIVEWLRERNLLRHFELS
jgi:hypothetical protein